MGVSLGQMLDFAYGFLWLAKHGALKTSTGEFCTKNSTKNSKNMEATSINCEFLSFCKHGDTVDLFMIYLAKNMRFYS